MSHKRLEYLFNLRLRQSLSGEEEKEWKELLLKPENKAIVEELTERLLNQEREVTSLPSEAAKGILQAIFQAEPTPLANTQAEHTPFADTKTTNIPDNSRRIIRLRGWKFAAAAALLGVIGIGTYLFLNNTNNTGEAPLAVTTEAATEIKTGGQKAILVLADGSRVALDTLSTGLIQKQGATEVIKTSNGEISYSSTALINRGEATGYNMISTPKGGQYQVTLADGSRVWLNAASSIRFPTSFTGSKRQVEITGEAYFEIASDSKLPFRVTVSGMEVQVLGTQFNINAYPDEADIKTTLLEGSVKIIASKNAKILKPGQQAIVTLDPDGLIDVQTAHTEEVVAWKNGLFQMSGTPIPSVMRQVSRWYDVAIEYPNGLPEGTISGKIPRDMNFSNLLEVLQKSGINLKFTNNRIQIFP